MDPSTSPPHPIDRIDRMRSLAEARPASLGSGRLVCIDGPAGSGKTTLAQEFAKDVGARVIPTDALMDGWRGLDAVGEQAARLCADLARDQPGRYDTYDWALGRYTRSITVDPRPWLILEGVGSGSPLLSAWITTLVWVEADADVRRARVLARDGDASRPHLAQFQRDEEALFAAEDTRARADLRLRT